MADHIEQLKRLPPLQFPVCSTCAHYRDRGAPAHISDCLATSTYADWSWARPGLCGGGKLWEPKPLPVPILVRFKRWLVG